LIRDRGDATNGQHESDLKVRSTTAKKEQSTSPIQQRLPISMTQQERQGEFSARKLLPVDKRTFAKGLFNVQMVQQSNAFLFNQKVYVPLSGPFIHNKLLPLEKECCAANEKILTLTGFEEYFSADLYGMTGQLKIWAGKITEFISQNQAAASFRLDFRNIWSAIGFAKEVNSNKTAYGKFFKQVTEITFQGFTTKELV